MLFVAAKVSHLGILPQGQPERPERVRRMVAQMDDEGFGNCTNYLECEAACPKEISVGFIARMNRDYLRASLAGKPCCSRRATFSLAAAKPSPTPRASFRAMSMPSWSAQSRMTNCANLPITPPYR